MIWNPTPYYNSSCSANMPFDDTLWTATFTGIASNTNVTFIFPNTEVRCYWKDNFLAISLPGSQFLMSPLQMQATLVCREGDKRIHEPDISTPVAVDQRAANCQEEASRLFRAMWSRCQSSLADITFRHPLPVFRFVRCSSVHCFQTTITLKLFHCTRAAVAL